MVVDEKGKVAELRLHQAHLVDELDLLRHAVRHCLLRVLAVSDDQLRICFVERDVDTADSSFDLHAFLKCVHSMNKY